MLIFLYMKFSVHSILLDRFMMIYLLTAIGLTPSGSSTVHIYTKNYTEQNIHNNNCT